MTDNDTPLAIALAYFRAWTSGDFEGAMAFVADDIVCRGPAGRIDGAEAFREFMGPFAGMLKRADIVAAYGDDTTALVMYDADTVAVEDAPGAECLTVEGGKIVCLRIVFDRLPFEQARRSKSTRS